MKRGVMSFFHGDFSSLAEAYDRNSQGRDHGCRFFVYWFIENAVY